MSKKVRWGLLSTANINKAVIPAFRQSPRGELVAVASRSQESAEYLCQGVGNSPVFWQLSGYARFWRS